MRFRTDSIRVESPSGELKIVMRIRPFRRHTEWQIQVRDVVMDQGKGGMAVIFDRLLEIAADLDRYNLTAVAGDARALAYSMEEYL